MTTVKGLQSLFIIRLSEFIYARIFVCAYISREREQLKGIVRLRRGGGSSELRCYSYYLLTFSLYLVVEDAAQRAI